jgi:hypothetical protein
MILSIQNFVQNKDLDTKINHRLSRSPLLTLHYSQTKTTMKQFLLLAAALARAGADEYNHRYKAGDKVDLWVNKVSFQRV